MTEQEWLTSTDPQAMLAWLPTHGHEVIGKTFPHPLRVSDRKLRLFDDACFAAFGLNIDDVMAPQDNPPAGAAAMLRDIVGNPFRPVRLPPLWKAPMGTACYSHPWLTHTVLSLATAAYEERGRKCERCTAHPDPKWQDQSTCLACNQTGIIDNGQLDPDRLLILADALEEAGCTVATYRQSPLLNVWLCTACESLVELKNTFVQGNLKQAWSCPNHGWRSETGVKGTRTICEPNPLLDHLRTPGPHYRGCWVLDLILGKN